MAVQTILPTEATPLDTSRKRKHRDSVNLPGHGEGSVNHATATSHPRPAAQNGNYAAKNLPEDSAKAESDADATDEDDEDDGDESGDDTLMEDIVDTFELEPYTPNEQDGMSDAEVSRLRDKLRRDGVQKFFEETIIAGQMEPRTLGMAFGMDPDVLSDDDDSYLRLLGIVVMRFFYKRQKLPQYNTVDDAADLLRRSKKIICITGAGISTSLGIPDFRSKGTGFYEKIREQGFQEAEEVFDIHSFDEDPSKFYSLAGDLLPDMNRYTPTHGFIRMLQDQNRLLTNYTQNIDNLEQAAGIHERHYIQCHGSFATACCRQCENVIPGVDIFADIRAKRISYCKQLDCKEKGKEKKKASRPPKRSKSRSKSRSYNSEDEDEDDDMPEQGVMKPGITFFHEPLPNTFFSRLTDVDAQQTDLVIVIGTSLKVAPVSEIPNYLPHHVPHIYISKEPIKHVAFDIQLLGNCDDVVVELCRRAGWDLKHEMIAPNSRIQVRPYPDRGHFWHVDGVGQTSQDASSNAEAPPSCKSDAHKTPV